MPRAPNPQPATLYPPPASLSSGLHSAPTISPYITRDAAGYPNDGMPPSFIRPLPHHEPYQLAPGSQAMPHRVSTVDPRGSPSASHNSHHTARTSLSENLGAQDTGSTSTGGDMVTVTICLLGNHETESSRQINLDAAAGNILATIQKALRKIKGSDDVFLSEPEIKVKPLGSGRGGNRDIQLDEADFKNEWTAMAIFMRKHRAPDLQLNGDPEFLFDVT